MSQKDALFSRVFVACEIYLVLSSVLKRYNVVQICHVKTHMLQEYYVLITKFKMNVIWSTTFFENGDDFFFRTIPIILYRKYTMRKYFLDAWWLMVIQVFKPIRYILEFSHFVYYFSLFWLSDILTFSKYVTNY